MNSSWYEKREKDLAKELERINNTVAKLFLSDIRSVSLESDIHLTENEISDIKTCENLLTESLRKFLEVLIKGRLKKSSVGQVIIGTARPRSAVLPITFGLRPETVDMFGSRWLIDKLWKLDFPVSFYAIKRYKQSVTSNDDSLSAIATRKAEFFQWIADNVNNNISILDPAILQY